MKDPYYRWIRWVALVAFAVCPSSNAEETTASARPAETEKIVVYHSHSTPFPERGIRVALPNTISAADKGKTIEVTCTITNALEEAAFIGEGSKGSISLEYREEDGLILSNGGGGSSNVETLYSLLNPSRVIAGRNKDGRTLVIHGRYSSTSRILKIPLPDEIKSGGTLSISISIDGYYKKNGNRFSGNVDVPIKIVD